MKSAPTAPRLPIAWLAPEWSNGDHYNFGLAVEVDKRELELAINDAPGTPDDARASAPLVPVRGRTVLDLPAGRRAELSSFDPRVDLRLVGARRIDGPASFLANVLRAGLLLGLALASLAPLAVLLSRFLFLPVAPRSVGRTFLRRVVVCP